MRETGCGAPHPELANTYCTNFYGSSQREHGPWHSVVVPRHNNAGGVTAEPIEWPVKRSDMYMLIYGKDEEHGALGPFNEEIAFSIRNHLFDNYKADTVGMYPYATTEKIGWYGNE